MNGWFLALIIIYVLNLGMTLSSHGKPREGTHNFWTALLGSSIGLTLIYFAIAAGF